MRRFMTFIGLLCAGFTSEVRAGDILRFRDLPVVLQQRSPELEAGRQDVMARKAQVGGMGSSFLPTFEVEAGRIEERGGSAHMSGLTGSINLYRGGLDEASRKVLHLESEEQNQELSMRSAELLARARTHYLSLVAAKLHRQEIVAMQRRLKDSEAIMARRLRAGLASKSDQLGLGLQQLKLEHALLELEKATLESEGELRRLTGFDSFVPEPDLDPSDLQKELAEGFAIKDSAKAPLSEWAKHKVALAEAQAAAASKGWIPEVDLFGSVDRRFGTEGDLEEERHVAVGLLLTMDLGRGAESAREKERYRHEVAAASLRASQVTRHLQDKERQATAELDLLRRSIEQAQRVAAKAEERVRALTQEFASGAAPFTDLLEAQWEHFESVHAVHEQTLAFGIKVVEVLAWRGQ